MGWIAAIAMCLVGFTPTSQTPNLIVVLCDDLGWGDVRAFNPDSKIPMPAWERLAREGMCMTDMHSGSSVCSPTRYGLLTGRYAWRTRLQKGVLGGLSPTLLASDRTTMANLAKRRDYATACVGKWHLGLDWHLLPGKTVSELSIETEDQAHSADYTQPFRNGPLAFGFDRYFGISGSLDMVPYIYLEQDRVTALPTVDKRFPMVWDEEKGETRLGPATEDFEAEAVMARFTEESIRFIEENAHRPFFLYLPFASPHTPIVPTQPFQGKSGLNAYADFVMETDHQLGRLLHTLDRLDLAERTIVVFTSDNGCATFGNFAYLTSRGHHPSGPFRGHKADLFEGGHRVPFTVRWPGRIAAGSRSPEIATLSDLFATFAEILDLPLAANEGEDSTSLLDTWLGKKGRSTENAESAGAERKGIVNHSVQGAFAIRSGRWKLLLAPGSGGWSKPRPKVDDTSGMPDMQLYDLEADPGETVNRIDEEREVADRLLALLENYVARGRSTPGPDQSNDAPIDIHRGITDARR